MKSKWVNYIQIKKGIMMKQKNIQEAASLNRSRSSYNPWKRLLSQIWKHRISYAFLLPFASIFILFTVLPVIISVFYSFTYNNLLEPPKFIGFTNYIKLFTNDDVFITALKNTLIFATITGPVGYVLSFLVAWLINELPNKLRSLFVLIFYSPSIAGSIYIIFAILFSGDFYGYINATLIKLGFIQQPIQWLVDPKYMSFVVIVCVLWTSMGAGFLSFVAGLKSMDKQYYEAAAIDGIKNRWQELWYVTLPLMKPQLMFGAILSITGAFSIHEVTMALFGFPSTGYAAHTVVNHLYDYGYLRFDMGYASSISTILFIIMIGCNKAINYLLRKVGQ
jgi:multiple sugar transport system permease protein